MIQTTNGRFVSCVSLCFPCYAQGAEIHEIFGKGKRFSERAHTSLILGLGDMTLRGEEVAVSVELVNGQDNSNIWGDRYTRSRSVVFEVEEYFAEAIADALGVQLTSEEKEKLTKRTTESEEAYSLYLRGQQQYWTFTRKGNERSRGYFNQALLKDPHFAMAHAGLAQAFAGVGFFGWEPAKDVWPRAKEMALTALEIDDSIAVGHAALGQVLCFFEWDWEGAERAFRRAIALGPYDPENRMVYADSLVVTGRHEQAIAEAERALLLDPVSAPTNRTLAAALYSARRYDASIEQSVKTIELAPNYAPGYNWLGLAYTAKGEYDDALAAFEKGLSLAEQHPNLQSNLAVVSALTGRHEKTREILAKVQERHEREHFPASCVAMIFMSLGETGRTFEWLEKAFEEKDGILLYATNVFPVLDPIRDDPRFQDLLRRMNFLER